MIWRIKLRHYSEEDTSEMESQTFFFLFCGDVIFESSEITVSFWVYTDVEGSLKDVSAQGKEIQKCGNDGKRF